MIGAVKRGVTFAKVDEAAPGPAKPEKRKAPTTTEHEQAPVEQVASPTQAEIPPQGPKPAEYGVSNTLVSQDRAAELRAKLKAKFNGS